MSSTRKKIIESSILLFNSKGLANVRLQDIAEYNNISPGNLTYHYKTKKDLMDYIIYVMIRKLVENEAKQKKLGLSQCHWQESQKTDLNQITCHLAN